MADSTAYASSSVTAVAGGVKAHSLVSCDRWEPTRFRLLIAAAAAVTMNPQFTELQRFIYGAPDPSCHFRR